MTIIGYNVAGHDDGIFLVDNEKKDIFGLDLERVTRIKHDGGMISPILTTGFLGKYLKKPLIISKSYESSSYFLGYPYYWHYADIRKKRLTNYKTHHLLQNIYQLIPKSLKVSLSYHSESFVKKIYQHNIEKAISMEVQTNHSYDHHLCHAASSYLFSPYHDAVCVTLDGYGDNYFSKVFRAKDKELMFLYGSSCKERKLYFDIDEFSIGLFYGLCTQILGFRINSDEGKVEALASYGNFNNKFYDFIMKNTEIKIDDGISIRASKELIALIQNKRKLLAIKNKLGDMNFAAAIQQWLENITIRYMDLILSSEKSKNICLSGGVFANVKVNQKIFEKFPGYNLYIFPAMGDNGAIAGAAVLENLKQGENISWIKDKIMPYWGPEYSDHEILQSIQNSIYANKIQYEFLGKSWPEYAAALISKGKIIGIFHDRMEYGPRALGNRSILADPRNDSVKEDLNNKIKKREWFQPFCPSILESERDKLFESSYNNKHMSCAFSMKKEYHTILPAIIHIDGTARAQFVDSNDNPNYHQLLCALRQETGYGVVLNTSFNKHGRTMVMSPEHAIIDFIDCNLDHLLLSGYLVSKK